MRIEEIREQARSQMNAFGFDSVPLVMAATRSTLGYVRWKKHGAVWRVDHLGLSKFVLPEVSEYRVNDVILHEIAHLMRGGKAGHDHEWKRICVQIGAEPKSHIDEDFSHLSPWHGICKHGVDFPMDASPRRLWFCMCPDDCPKVERIISWSKDGVSIAHTDMASNAYRRSYLAWWNKQPTSV